MQGFAAGQRTSEARARARNRAAKSPKEKQAQRSAGGSESVDEVERELRGGV